MPKFAANLSMMYNEVDFLDRFAAAAEDGFKGVEFLFPYSYLVGDIRARLDRHGLTQALFNCPPGDWAAGERGIACLPGREEEFRRGMERALGYAHVLGNQCLHVMAGVQPPEHERVQCRDVYLNNLDYAARQAAEHGVTILIEPINPRDMPGYFLGDFDLAIDLIRDFNSPRLKLQYDIYHRQILRGDVSTSLSALLPIIGHIQIASVPGRHEPRTGELNDDFLLRRLEAGGVEVLPALQAGSGIANQRRNRLFIRRSQNVPVRKIRRIRA